MTTHLNLLGILGSKGASAAASSSGTAGVLSSGDTAPEQSSSFFSALMQMLFRQSVDPRTIRKAMQGETATTPEEKAKEIPPEDRAAESVRALTFLSHEKMRGNIAQMQQALHLCEEQLKMRLPGEPGALLSYSLTNTGEHHAGVADGILPDDAAAAAAQLVSALDEGSVPMALPADSELLKGAQAEPVSVPPEPLPAVVAATAAAVPQSVMLQTAADVPAAMMPEAQSEQRPQGKNTSGSAQQVTSGTAPQMPAAVREPIMERAKDEQPQVHPPVVNIGAGERTEQEPPRRHPEMPQREPLIRAPHSVTVQVPRSGFTVPAGDEAPLHAKDNRTPVNTISSPSIQGEVAEAVQHPEPLQRQQQSGRSPLQQTIEPPLRGVKHQPHQQSPLPAGPADAILAPEPESRPADAKVYDAAAFLDEILSGGDVKSVQFTGGANGSAAPQQDAEQKMPQQSVPQEAPAAQAVPQKEFAVPSADRGVIGAPAPAEPKIHSAQTAPAAPVNAPMFDRAAVQNMFEQLSKGVSIAVNEHHSEMRIVMHPESLGEVTLRVQVEEGKVSTTMDVQQTQVKQTIEANIPQLREALSAKGLTMDRIEVTTAQNGMTGESARNRQGNDRKKGRQEFELMQDDASSVKLYGYNTVEYTV
ncbi:MAG: flagellar hook-length control protein FliK [Bacteroidetes bacterium]|nr:flagellar hook-length control protein FliK [Bacteroidota bacterium]